MRYAVTQWVYGSDKLPDSTSGADDGPERAMLARKRVEGEGSAVRGDHLRSEWAWVEGPAS